MWTLYVQPIEGKAAILWNHDFIGISVLTSAGYIAHFSGNPLECQQVKDDILDTIANPV